MLKKPRSAVKPKQRCQNCRWWEPKHVYQEIGTCVLTESGDIGTPPKKSLATASSDDGYFGVLNTSPDFGCVQWENKEHTT